MLSYNARYYDPGIGRFISADTVVPGSNPLTVAPFDDVARGAWSTDGYGPASPQDLNRYSYALNNPVRYTDPTGHCVPGPILVLCAIVGAGAVLALAATAASSNGRTDLSDVDWTNWSFPAQTNNDDEPISDNVTRLPDDELEAPSERGQAPISKKDGFPVEIHHQGQRADGPFEEMTRTDHRGKGNHSRNHPNRKSEIDRDKWKRDRQRYWEKEWDRGRGDWKEPK